MQLYTIGLHELNDDGSEVRDEHGRMIQTYTNLDILSNARVFTGFAFTARRGNVEELFRSEKSRIDPLRIEVDKHVSVLLFFYNGILIGLMISCHVYCETIRISSPKPPWTAIG